MSVFFSELYVVVYIVILTLIRHKEELTWAGLEREKKENSAWWQQFEEYMGAAGLDIDGWDSIEHGKCRDFLTLLGYPS